MYKSDRERKIAAEAFAEEWKERGQERGECQLFWIELLQTVYGVENAERFILFEDKVKIEKRTKYKASRIPSTHTLIKQKSRDINLSKKRKQSDKKGMTPIKQAR